jgi:hypothetical protein
LRDPGHGCRQHCPTSVSGPLRGRPQYVAGVCSEVANYVNGSVGSPIFGHNLLP